MSQLSAPGLRPHVLAIKQQLAEGRAKLRARHEKGSPGVQVCRAQTELFDTIVNALFEQTLADLNDTGPDGLRKHVALVPHGGYGRGDVAPFSDVDLMILHTPTRPRGWGRWPNAWCATCTMWGRAGQSVRTVRDACQLARTDATICTSLVDRGISPQCRTVRHVCRAVSPRGTTQSQSLLEAIEKARAEERTQFGDSVYLLEPNVKRSPARCAVFNCCVGSGLSAMEPPNRTRCVGKDNSRVRTTTPCSRPASFLLRMRNEMHYHAARPTISSIAVSNSGSVSSTANEDRDGMLAVEQFMRHYFLRTQAVQESTAAFAMRARVTAGSVACSRRW